MQNRIFSRDRIHSPSTHYIDRTNAYRLYDPDVKEEIHSDVKHTLLYDSMMNFKASRNYMLFMPVNKPSFAMMQAHWVFVNPENDFKSYVLIADKKVVLPDIIKNHYVGELDRLSGQRIEIDFTQDTDRIVEQITKPNSRKWQDIISVFGKSSFGNIV